MLRRNVLIFHGGALGDFVLSWPLALALGRLYPQSRIIYVAAAGKGALAEKALRVESTDAESGWHHLFGDAGQLPDNCRRRLEGSHLVFSFAASDAWRKSVAQIAPDAKVMLLATRPPAEFSDHASEFLLQSLSNNTIVQTGVRQLLASIASQGIGISRPRDGGILIHPGSGSRDKCWPVDSFINLLERLRGDGKRARVIIGEVEMDRNIWSEKELSRFSELAELIKSPTYLELFNELSHAAAFVGNDSGPTHLAGIIGVPTLALFGPTDPAIWKPLGPSVSALHGMPLTTLAVDQVYDAVKQIS